MIDMCCRREVEPLAFEMTTGILVSCYISSLKTVQRHQLQARGIVKCRSPRDHDQAIHTWYHLIIEMKSQSRILKLSHADTDLYSASMMIFTPLSCACLQIAFKSA